MSSVPFSIEKIRKKRVNFSDKKFKKIQSEAERMRVFLMKIGCIIFGRERTKTFQKKI